MVKKDCRTLFMFLGIALPLFSTTTMPYPWSFQETPKQLMVWGGIVLGGGALFGLSVSAGAFCYYKYRFLKGIESLQERIKDVETKNEDLREAGRTKGEDIHSLSITVEDVNKFGDKLITMTTAKKASKPIRPCTKCLKISQWTTQHKSQLNDTLRERQSELAKLQNALAKLVLNNEI